MGDDIPDIKMMKVSDFCLSTKFCSRSESYFRLYFSNLWWKRRCKRCDRTSDESARKLGRRRYAVYISESFEWE